jgi:hypothetical protein
MKVAQSTQRTHDNRPKYAIVPREIAENPALSDAACRLFTALDSITLGHNGKQVTLQRLAEQMGWSRSKMSRARKELEAAGLIETQRTFRSPKVTVRNPVRDGAAAHNGTQAARAARASHVSPVTQEPESCVTSDAPSCVTSDAPIQEYRKENKQQSNSGCAPQGGAAAIAITGKTAAAMLAGEVETYLQAIAERTGHTIEANKVTRPLIAAIAARGMSAQHTALEVDAGLAAANGGVKNPPGFIVKVLLPALAEKPIQESPKPTPTPAPYLTPGREGKPAEPTGEYLAAKTGVNHRRARPVCNHYVTLNADGSCPRCLQLDKQHRDAFGEMLKSEQAKELAAWQQQAKETAERLAS